MFFKKEGKSRMANFKEKTILDFDQNLEKNKVVLFKASWYKKEKS